MLTTISDKRLCHTSSADVYYTAHILAVTDYYPFGAPMAGRTQEQEGYRFGFNGQERDDEVYGTGNLNTALFWEYDTRLGRRWNLDPITYPWHSAYATNNSNPIYYIDPLGLFGSESDAREYKRKHNLKGKIHEGVDGVYSIVNKKEGLAWHRETEDIPGIIMPEDRVFKSASINIDDKNDLSATPKPKLEKLLKNWGVSSNIFGALDIPSALKLGLVEWAVRTNYKSNSTLSGWEKLNKKQQNWRITNTLGKNGATYIKVVKGIGLVGVGVSLTYSFTEAAVKPTYGNIVRAGVQGTILVVNLIPVYGPPIAFTLGVIEYFAGDYLYDYIDKKTQ